MAKRIRRLAIAERALQRIAECSIPGDVDHRLRLDSKDAIGFIRIARQALREMEGDNANG